MNSTRKDERTDFIKRKYVDLEFVNEENVKNLDKAIKDGNVLEVYHSICVAKKHGTICENNPLHIATAYGNPIICLLVALNVPNVDTLDKGGWSALSYATYYENEDVINVLMSVGCDPNCSTNGHPYKIAESQNNNKLKTLFLPYWKGNQNEEANSLTPPINYNPPNHNICIRKCTSINLFEAFS